MILRASTYRRTRWKNGGGETMEIAISPQGASLEDFDWRLSMATVASDGPFSRFPGVDRTLCILEGAGIRLQVGDEPPRRLDDTTEPFAFSGDVLAHSTLIDGVVTDFNVMTRRDRWRHRTDRVRLRAGDLRDLAADIRAVFCQSGLVSIAAETGEIDRLYPRDTLLRAESDRRPLRVRADADAVLYVVTLSARNR